ncbi:MAG: beta-galactosidase [Muribaculum sp.]|nr:beta-galactosidase [Muribaculum sp.]
MIRNILASILCILGMSYSSVAFSERIYLSGTGPDDAKKWDFYCSEGQNSGKWTKIDVPSCWELQGFGDYTYGRFYKTEGLKPSKETGTYRTNFTVPKSCNGDRIRITFEGVMTDAKVSIDGKQVGDIHQGGFTEFSYDITDYVRPGKRHKLEVEVKKESDNKSVNSAERRADWWLFDGIYRPVYIESVPASPIQNLAIDARANGDLYVNQTGLTLNLDGREINFDPVAGCFHCGDVKTWDPEHPNLYSATFSLPDKSHSVTKRIGFRTIEFRPHDGIYLNGTKLVVKGTNRHCFHPESGRTTSKALSIQDAKLIKQMNMNAVRSHYPPDSHFLDVCDSIGLLYIDEFPGWQTAYDDTTARKLLPEFIYRDVNHPCIFLWSNGNEGGWNTSVDSLFYTLDPQKRRVIHPWSDFDEIDTHHYPAYQTGTYRMQNGQNVFMPTEFLHSKYDKGGGASLEDMWDHWSRSPLFAGGFIWAYIDEAVRRTDLDGILDSDGGNGPDGVLDPYRNPEGSFFTIREVWSPVYIDRLNITPDFDGKIPIENRSLFSNLNEYGMTYFVLSEKGNVIDSGLVKLPEILPGEKSFASLPVSNNFYEGDILTLTAIRKIEGDTVCTWSAPIHRAAEQVIPHTNATRLNVDFNENGTIREIKVKDKEVTLNGGPLPVGMLADCYRHETRREQNGDIVNTFFYRGGIDSIQWRQTQDGKLLMDAVVLNDERGHGYKGNFLTKEGNWQLGLTFDYPEENFSNGNKSVTYLGNGPYRVWRNRIKGTQFGVWTKEYNNTVTGEYNTLNPPVYPEFKGYHANVHWMQFPHFRVTSLTDGLFVRLYTPEEAVDQTPGEMGGIDEGKRKQERTMIDFPAGDISFLLSIPPMRSYKPLEQLGPAAQPDNIRIKKGDEGFHIRLLFDFSTPSI